MAELQDRNLKGKGKGKHEEVFRDETAQFNISSQLYQDLPKQNIAFINLTVASGTTQDADKRRLVRSHVIRNARHQKRIQEYGERKAQKAILPWSTQPFVPGLPSVALTGATFTQKDRQPESDAAFQDVYWNTMPNLVSSQGTCAMVPAAPIIPVSVSGSDNAMWTGDMTLSSSSSKPGTVQYYSAKHHEDGHTFGLRAEVEGSSSEMGGSQLSLFPIANLSIEPSPSRGRLDPFDTLPFLPHARSQALMYHYKKVLVKSMLAVAVDPEDKWFGYSMTDPALFHTTMLHSAAHTAMLSGEGTLVEDVALKWEAIRLVNDRLGDPVLSLSDVTIGAVAALLLYENQSANVEMSNIHMNGLCQMVLLRGGLENLGLAGILRRKIFWADLCNAMYSHAKPRFNTLSPLELSSEERDTPTAITRFRSFQAYDSQLQAIFTSLRSLSASMTSPFTKMDIAIDEIYTLERRAVVLLAETNPALQPSLHSTPEEQYVLPHRRRTAYQVSLAALIYIYLFLRDTLVPSPIFSVLVSRLHGSLYSLDDSLLLDTALQERSLNDEDNNILFWALVLGALAADGRRERHTFATSLQSLFNLHGIRTFTGFVEKLQNFAWVGRKADDKLMKVWGDIQALY